MEWNWKEPNQGKTLFKTVYCLECKQVKVCGKLDLEYCCKCFYKIEEERAKEHLTYEKALITKNQARQETLKELKQLRTWKEKKQCSYCGKKSIQQDWLLSSELVCLECSQGHAENCFTVWQKWYKKWWGIEIVEWLEKYQRLPVNKNCASKWKENKEHLEKCDCLEIEVKDIYLLFSNSLKETKEKMKDCKCERSEKVRVDYTDSRGSGWTYCEKCEKRIESAGHHGVVKNRNDPKFWGLEVKEKVLCLGCLGELVGEMPSGKKYTFRKYVKRGY